VGGNTTKYGKVEIEAIRYVKITRIELTHDGTRDQGCRAVGQLDYDEEMRSEGWGRRCDTIVERDGVKVDQ
jgi:hypothetical protein